VVPRVLGAPVNVQVDAAIDPVTDGQVGPYRLIRMLGNPPKPSVFLAVHRRLGQVRAVRVLAPQSSQTKGRWAKRFASEARAAMQLRHPGILQLFDYGTLATGGAFVAMEYVEGEPASRWLRRMGRLSEQPLLAAALVGAVADALAHAHARGIVHRDVEPENILLVPDPDDRQKFTVKVLELGVTRILRGIPADELTAGNPRYRAPEQWLTGRLADERADIYALGCMLFELIAGRVPFASGQDCELMHAHLYTAPPDLRSFAPRAPAEIERLVARMLAKAPQRRHQTMEEVVMAVELILSCRRWRFGELLRAPPTCAVSSDSTLAPAEE